MMASELIAALQAAIETHGDRVVTTLSEVEWDMHDWVPVTGVDHSAYDDAFYLTED